MLVGRPSAASGQKRHKLKGGIPPLSFLFVLLGLYCFPLHTALAEPSPAEVSELHGRAAALGLSTSRTWEVLLHYKPNLFGKPVSLIDDPAFFLAASGKTDPDAELSATLEGLLAPVPEDNPQQHLRCRFPARSEWLIAQLGLTEPLLPSPRCTDLDKAMESISPQSAVLIFPGNHNNSPASMFGHTLISIEGPYESRLLSFAVNYAAHTDETNGVLFALKGVFGLYPGYYSLLPYYVKVREYNDLERRDVWEYELNLEPEEVRRMTLHAWELQNMASAYFFFDENCSYDLLFLLEVARPSINLTDQCRPWVIPIDTVRIVRGAGLVDKVVYRPSKATRIATLAKRMESDETELALELLAGDLSPHAVRESGLSLEAQMRIVDVAIETLEFRYYRKEFTQKEYQGRSLELLRVRSELGVADEDYHTFPRRDDPDRGHGSNRLALGGGYWNDSWYLEARLRPAYHNLLDADEGYLPGSQIDFFNLTGRYYPEKDKGELYAFDLVNIVSLSPRHPFFRPTSWKVETGFRQHLFADRTDHLVYRLNPGGGMTWGSSRSMAFALAEADVLVSGRFKDSHAAGGGATLGTLLTLTHDWKLYASVRHIWYELGETHRALEASLKQNWRLSADSSIELDLSRHHTADHYASDASLLLNLYW